MSSIRSKIILSYWVLALGVGGFVLFASVNLFWAGAILIVFAWSGGHLLYLTVGKPLQQLEQQLKPLTQGRFQVFQMVSQDRELVSLTQALNRMLEELELRRQQLLQTEKLASLGILALGVAHELNNPLGNISGTSQILLEELTHCRELRALPEESRQALQSWLEQIDHETSRAQGIVRALLDYSRKPLPQPALPVALAEILEKSLLLLHHRLPATLEAIQTDIPSELLVRIDPNRLQQVLINLLQNALEAGGAEVEIQIQAHISSPHAWPPPNAVVLIGQPPTTEGVIISFCDHGPGIDPALMPHIFDPFFTTRAPGEGTGLGLYIVSEIIQEQQGCIAVNSPAQGGVCFKLWLPL